MRQDNFWITGMRLRPMGTIASLLLPVPLKARGIIVAILFLGYSSSFAALPTTSATPATLPPPPAAPAREYVIPQSVSNVNEVFWEAVKHQEATSVGGYSHWKSRPRLPRPGDSDRSKSGAKAYVSFGISQVQYWYSAKNANVGPEKAAIAGMNWDWNRYLYDPVYNEALGRRYFFAAMKKYNNNPCQAFAAYNWGFGGANAWIKRGYKSPVNQYVSEVATKARHAAANYG
jgi:hypothetical protein